MPLSMRKQAREKIPLPNDVAGSRLLASQHTSPQHGAGMQQWHTHTGMCLAQGAFSAFIFLASHARRHICVYCRGWEFSTGANY